MVFDTNSLEHIVSCNKISYHAGHNEGAVGLFFYFRKYYFKMLGKQLNLVIRKLLRIR